MTCCELHKIVNDADFTRTDSWSFNDALGDTVMEKFESLYVKLMGICDKPGMGGISHIICGKDVASLFEVSCSFKPDLWYENIALFKLEFYKSGSTNYKFNIYVDTAMTNSMYVCGKCGGVVRLTIKDFII